jgi:hypothetical protein
MPRGGARTGAGRKSKAEEMGLPSLIEEVIGDTGKRALIEKIRIQAESGSFLHQQMLMHYIYGKPSDTIDVTTNGKDITNKEIVFRDYGKPPVQQ